MDITPPLLTLLLKYACCNVYGSDWKVIFDIIPLRVLPPLVMGSILYPMVGLVEGWSEFGSFLLVLILFNLTSSALCLFIGIVFQESGVASLIGSLVMLFSLLFAGLLLNHGTHP